MNASNAESEATAGRLTRLGRWLAGSSLTMTLWGWLLVGVIAFRLSANFVLNHFYADGAGVDAWLLAAVIWRNDPTLTMPAAAVFPPQLPRNPSDVAPDRARAAEPRDSDRHDRLVRRHDGGPVCV